MPAQTTLDAYHAARGRLRLVTETVAGASGETAALALDTNTSHVTCAGASDNGFSLADGKEGQRKLVLLTVKASTGTAVITPANLWGGTTVTLDTVGDFAEFVYLGTGWGFVGGTGAVLA